MVEFAKVVEGVDAGAVSVAPFGLPAVAADEFVGFQVEALRGVADGGLLAAPEHVGLAVADGAGAGFADSFERDVAFVPVAPRDGELGADDFISKPVGMRVLLARVEAVTRRMRPRNPPSDTAVRVRGALVIDPDRLRVTYRGVDVPVTVTEFKLIEALSSRPGIVYSRDRLLEAIREDAATVAPRIIDTYIGRLRKKLGEIDPASREIETVVGAGYRWRDGE